MAKVWVTNLLLGDPTKTKIIINLSLLLSIPSFSVTHTHTHTHNFPEVLLERLRWYCVPHYFHYSPWGTEEIQKEEGEEELRVEEEEEGIPAL